MGNTVYIAGEVDMRVFAFDKPFFVSTNLCLRRPIFLKSPSDDFKLDYKSPLTTMWLNAPENVLNQIYDENFRNLRMNDTVKYVVLKADENFLGGFSNIELISQKIVPQVETYAMK